MTAAEFTDPKSAPAPAETVTRPRRRSRFGGIALGIAGVSATMSLMIYVAGSGAGFEGWGAMLVSAVLALFGGVVACGFALVSFLRHEQPQWPAQAAVVISLGVILWLNVFA